MLSIAGMGGVLLSAGMGGVLWTTAGIGAGLFTIAGMGGTLLTIAVAMIGLEVQTGALLGATAGLDVTSDVGDMRSAGAGVGRVARGGGGGMAASTGGKGTGGLRLRDGGWGMGRSGMLGDIVGCLAVASGGSSLLSSVRGTFVRSMVFG